MISDTTLPSQKQRFEFLRAALIPVIVFGLGPLILGWLQRFIYSPRGYWLATVLVWRLGPWGRFPIPFDRSAFDGYITDDLELLTTISLFVAGFLVFGIVLSAFHGCIFACIALIYRYFGWPPYFRDIRERLVLLRMWKSSVLQSWWIIPFFGLIHSMWTWLNWGQLYAQCVIINVEWPFTIAILVLAFATFVRIIARRLVSSIQMALSSDDELRCIKCGYMVRGLSGSLCPECGFNVVQEWPPRFSLLRRRSIKRHGISRVAWPVLVLFVVTAPAWEPAIMSMLPVPFVYRLPDGIRFFYTPSSQIPVKQGAFCILRQETNTAVFYMPSKRSCPSDIYWWCWKANDAQDGVEPTAEGSLKLVPRGTNSCAIGPHVVQISLTDWQQEWWVWLFPDKSKWQIEVVSLKDAPPVLKNLAAKIKTK